MKPFVPFLFFLFSVATGSTQASNTWSVKFADAIISRYSPTIDAMTGKGWEYSNTIVLHGIEKVYNQVLDANYLNYIKTYVDGYLNADGSFKAGVSLVSLDRIHPGIAVLFLYEKRKSNAADSARYRTAATNLRNVLVGSSASYAAYRTPIHKIFWHKQSGYDNIMMLDGMYMAHPFLAKYGSLFNDNAAIDTAVNQTLFAYNQLYQSGTHLIKHAWKEPGSSGSVSWDDVAGNSTSVWSRAMGWYMMALVDELKYVPAGHSRRGELLTALSNLAAGIASYQDAGSHLWYQVVDKTSGTLSGNYLETSGSAMFVYALKTAADSGWINATTYLPVAQSGWTGLQTKISTYTDGKPQINDFAPAMSVQNTEALYVQSSLQGVDCPTASGTQHPHGYAAILMAASVMEFPLITLPLHFLQAVASPSAGGAVIRWEIADGGDVDYFDIERSTRNSDFVFLSSVPATQKSRYVFADFGLDANTAYYRIKAVTRRGSSLYSPVMVFSRKPVRSAFTINPNPIQGNEVRLSASQVQPGVYGASVVDCEGELVWNGSVSIPVSTTSNVSIRLPAPWRTGIYFLRITGNGQPPTVARFQKNE